MIDNDQTAEADAARSQAFHRSSLHPDTVTAMAEICRLDRVQIVLTETASGRRQFQVNALFVGDDVAGLATRLLEKFTQTEDFGTSSPERIVDHVLATTQLLMDRLSANGNMVYIGSPYDTPTHRPTENGTQS